MISAVQIAASGVANASAQFDRAAGSVVAAGSTPLPTDTVDLSSAALDVIGAQAGLALNIALLKATAEADARVLDILA